MMLNCGYAYKRAYKNAIKTAQSILHQKIGNTYEIFHGGWLNFEDFKATNTVERLWEKFVEYARAYTKNDNLLISEGIKKSICSDFTKHLNALIPIIKKYDASFHQLVYHMRYKEHVSNPDKIGPPETVRKNEIVVKQPIISNITKADQLVLDTISSENFNQIERKTLYSESTTPFNAEIKKRSSKSRSKSVRISDPIPSYNSIPVNTDDSRKKISSEELDALYEKEAKRDKKNKANMNRLLAT
ncbi:481_t:CDS:2 [Gigaspora rosea]|nr:481_t:CDS:2 [Gigaspora rosea]